MPKIEIPMRDITEVKFLRKDKEFAAQAEELITVLDTKKELEEREKELRPHLTAKLQKHLREGEKSIQFGGKRITLIERGASRRLNTQKLLNYMTAKQLERCYEEGDTPAPTVQIADIKEEKKQDTISRVTQKLRTGRSD